MKPDLVNHLTQPEHAVHRLYQYRKSISTKPFEARGKNLVRCQHCLLSIDYCTCDYRKPIQTNASFMLVMYDDEVLKPTNSGRLIADLVPDTHAFLWSRVTPNSEMLALLANEQYQPYLVFPSEYAYENQQIISKVSVTNLALNSTKQSSNAKKPLFVLLDGSWRQAVKMFRKSSYLHNLPMLSFDQSTVAKYALRKGMRDFQMGTAEVASLVLNVLGEHANASTFSAWFDLFIESSLLGRNRSSNKLHHREALIAIFSQTWQKSQEFN